MKLPAMSGRIQKAPENHLGADELERARRARRRFMGAALAMGAGAAAAAPPDKPRAPAGSGGAFVGDPNILELPEHSKALGLPVASTGYGSPSKWEKNIQRRPSPGLTQVAQASVSFCPLQSLFGIITPSGLHFERHHQGWWDIDPSKHR
ncbi:MAG: sulfite dehydrogenase, partial [Caldimonas sp.]